MAKVNAQVFVLVLTVVLLAVPLDNTKVKFANFLRKIK